MLRLLIARHGNTFDQGQTVCRVGLRTDLPLSRSGIDQAKKLGMYLKQYRDISHVYCSQLQRTKQTAQIAIDTANINCDLTISSIFNEVDYGIDDGKPEKLVVDRLGNEAITAWDKFNTVPNGWYINVEQLKQNWLDFSKQIIEAFPNSTVLVITSNGIAKFALNLIHHHKIDNTKIATGAVCEMILRDNSWKLEYWNKKI